MESNSKTKTNEIPETTGTEKDLALETDLKEIIEESKQKIHAEAPKDVSVKRGRGRPRKTSGSTSSDSRAVNTDEKPAAAVPSSTPPPDISTYIAGPLRAVSKLPASKYQIPDLALSEDEALLCAQSLNECVKAFVPDLNSMNPKTAAILSVALTFGSVGFTKYQIYQSVMIERYRQGTKTDPDKPTEIQGVYANQNQQSHANEYFRRQ